jgi:O-methyltransferase/methyltransferase family protein
MSSAGELRRLILGQRVSHAICVAAELGIADLLAAGPRTSEELAEATGTDADALYRLLRALASAGVLSEQEGRLFLLAELGDSLRSDAPDSVAAIAVHVGRPYVREAWSALIDSVRTGENAFRLVHGTSVWEYRASRPEDNAIFDRYMAATTRLATQSILDAYDFGRFESIVDVGGGNGSFLKALRKRHPAVRGIVFDQPHVLVGLDPGDGIEVVAGSFFESVPEGAAGYVLKTILHDWEDDQATAILRTVRRGGGTVLVVERLVGLPNEGPEAKFSDLNMLVGPGGRERTQDEYANLLDAADYRLVAATPSKDGLHILEAEPVTS